VEFVRTILSWPEDLFVQRREWGFSLETAGDESGRRLEAQDNFVRVASFKKREGAQKRWWYVGCLWARGHPCVKEAPANSGRLGQRLLAYWVRNPEAQGTVELIVEWWFLEQWIVEATAEVRSALSALVKENLVVERTQADGRVCYQLNRAKKEEIAVRLKKMKR
jgi:hypothetical protein